MPGHESKLVGDWYELEGVFGGRYRWIGASAQARLTRVKEGPQRLRIRGFAPEHPLPMDLSVSVNGTLLGSWKQDRPGLFVLDADLTPELQKSTEYQVQITASPTWTAPGDPRILTVTLGMIRLIPA